MQLGKCTMPNTEQIIVACASCATQYNVSTMAPGAKFKCQKCSTINIVPAVEEPIDEIIEEQAPPSPPPSPRPQIKTQAKAPLKPVTPPPRQPTSRVPPSRVAPALKKGLTSKSKLPARASSENDAENDDENTEISRKTTGALGGLLDKKNRKYLFIGGAVLLVLMAALYVMNSNKVYENNKRLGAKASAAIQEINGFVATKDYVQALEKSEAFIKEFNDCELPEVKKNVENTKKSIQGIEQTIEREKEGKAKLAELSNKKNSASLDQYEDLMKEFSKFITKYGEFGRLFDKAQAELKDIDTKLAAKQEEDDTKAYNDLLAEIKPMVDDGKIDAAIAHLKKYWDEAPKLSKRLQSALKKKLNELKGMK